MWEGSLLVISLQEKKEHKFDELSGRSSGRPLFCYFGQKKGSSFLCALLLSSLV